MKPKHTNKFLFTSITTCLALLLVVGSQSSAQAHESRNGRRTITYTSARLTDLNTDNQDALDGGIARVRIASRTGSDGTVSTKIKLRLHGVQADKGAVFGSHVHTGPCVEGDGAAAGPHFNITTFNGEERVVSPETEVWLDFTVKQNGRSTSRSDVDFLLPDGQAQSIVIHEMGTAPDGGAGPRLACIPI